MLDDMRNHDARPNEQERAWMSADPVSLMVRVVALAGIALAIGVSATQFAGPTPAATVASAPQ